MLLYVTGTTFQPLLRLWKELAELLVKNGGNSMGGTEPAIWRILLAPPHPGQTSVSMKNHIYTPPIIGMNTKSHGTGLLKVSQKVLYITRSAQTIKMISLICQLYLFIMKQTT